MQHPEPRRQDRRQGPIRWLWLGLALIGWGGTIWLGAALYATKPPSAGFDLELLLEAGRGVAAGLSPYDPALVAGTAPAAPSLFYSYPPPVAVATPLVAGAPSALVLVLWGVAAILGLLVVSDGLRRRLAPDLAREQVLLPVVAIAPFVFPFTIGLVFGNADVFFPLLYGAMLLGALAETRRGAIGAGVALALAALKLHPASLGLWFLGRGVRERSAGRAPVSWIAVAAAIVMGLVLIGGSLLAMGVGPWSDYLAVVRTGSGADIVDPRNAGPAAVLASFAGGDAAMARMLQVPITLAALAITFVAALRDEDVVESFTVASIASIVTLPVTWYHYPAALMPVAIAALLRARDARLRPTVALVAAAVVVGTVSVVWLPSMWAAVALLVGAVHASRPAPTTTAAPASLAAHGAV